jgi:hypothetical protein
MEPRNFIKPSSYNVILADVQHNDLVGTIATHLGVHYLGEGDENNMSLSSVDGILYGTNCRPMVNLVIMSKRFEKPRNIIFLIDSGSPCLYICDLAMRALGFNDATPPIFHVLFGGETHEAVMSPLLQADGITQGHYRDINLIGATFLRAMRAKVILDYKNLSCQLVFA